MHDVDHDLPVPRINIRFKPTVAILPRDPIVVTLWRFTNVLDRQQIHLTGPDANLIEASKAQWDQTRYLLTITVTTGVDEMGAPIKIKAHQKIQLTIQESQGLFFRSFFFLPILQHQEDSPRTDT